MGNRYELIETGSFACPCGQGRVIWRRKDYDDHVTDGPGSPTLDCTCGLVLWQKPTDGYYYVSATEKDEMEHREQERWELGRGASNLCAERYGEQWKAKVAEARKTKGAVRGLLREAGALQRLGSDSSITRHLLRSAASIASESLSSNPLGVLAALGIEDPQVQELDAMAKASHATFYERQEALCTRAVPIP